MLGWRITNKMTNAKGIALVKIPFRNEWYFGFILLEPDFKEFFLGWFKKGWNT